MFCRASDSLALIPKAAPSKFTAAMHEALGVPMHHLLINESNLLGIYCVLNSNGVVIPSFAEDAEVKFLKSLGLNVCTLNRLSPGNNLLANDYGAWVSPRVHPIQVTQISDCLGVEVTCQRMSVSALAASTMVTNAGLFSSSELPETELKQLEKIFKVKGGVGTTNNGVPYNSFALAANSNGALVGAASSGFETQRVFEALGGND
jgi:translation initiation factor 6